MVLGSQVMGPTQKMIRPPLLQLVYTGVFSLAHFAGDADDDSEPSLTGVSRDSFLKGFELW